MTTEEAKALQKDRACEFIYSKPICISHGSYFHNYAPIEVEGEGVRFFDSKEWICCRCGGIITLEERNEFERTVYKSPILGTGKYL